MTCSVEELLALRNRPPGYAAMLHEWRSLTFLHFSIEPELVQQTLPDGLTVDTYPDASGEERAWIGLVPFRMQGIRRPGFPPIPGYGAFPETNVRTYVHVEGKRPGVWFYSLDAAKSAACEVARRFYGLPYRRASMVVREEGSRVSYRSKRWWSQAATEVEVEILGDPQPAAVGTLDFWLIERYLLYAERGGQLFSGQVYHEPYRVQQAKVLRCEESLIQVNGFEARPWESVLYSPGVDVEVFPLQRLG